MAQFDESIVAHFGGDTSGLQKAIGSAQTMVGGFQSALGRIGVTVGTAAVIGFFKSVADKAGAIQDLSDSLGVTTNSLQAFGFAASKAGSSTEGTRQMWTSARKAIDELATGNKAAVEAFAALGLAASDFVGVPLDKALEKIAAGFVANKDQAGAFAAIADIVGVRSTKLLGVLEDLGRNGFGSLEEAARSAGQLIERETIGRLDELGDRMTEIMGSIIRIGARILDVITKIAYGLGALTGNAVNLLKGLDVAYLNTQKSAEAAVAGIDRATQAVKGQMATVKDFAAFNEREAKQEMERLKMQGKDREYLNALLQQANKYLDEAGTYQENSKEQLDLVGKANALILEYDKSILAYEKELAAVREKSGNDHIETMDRLAALRFARMTDEEKIAVLEKAREQIAHNIELAKAQGLDTSRMEVSLMQTENELADIRLRTERQVTEEKQKQKVLYGGNLGAGRISDVSTETLKAMRQQINSRMFQQMLADQAAGITGPAVAAGTARTGYVDYEAQSAVSAIDAELKFRTQFQRALQAGGTEGGLNYFANTGRDLRAFDAAVSQLSAWTGTQSEQTKALVDMGRDIGKISNRLDDVFKR